MLFKEVIKKKRDGKALTRSEIDSFVQGATHGSLPDYQLTAMLMAMICRGLSAKETAELTAAMVNSGVTVDFHRQGENQDVVYVDKHSSGGVGDKVSIILTPLMASVGVKVPMISGRALGHTGGTLDKLEAIPGFQVQQSLAEFQRLVQQVGCAMIGQTDDLAPADRKLYALRDVSGTVESASLICASILSKKFAAGIDALVMDIKVGNGAFMKNLDEAQSLARHLLSIGAAMQRPVVTIFTDMNQPLGHTIGNALEVQESIEALQGKWDDDLREVTFALGVEMLRLARLEPERQMAIRRMQEAIATGAALKKFAEMIGAQGGDARVCHDTSLLPQARHQRTLCSRESGFVTAIDTEAMGLAAILLGGGRQQANERLDHAVGLSVHKKIGDPIKPDESLVTIHYNDATHLAEVEEIVMRAYQISAAALPHRPLILQRLSTEVLQ